MPEVPDVGAIAQQIKARIKQIEDQLKRHGPLTDELERLRDALTRLEGAARSRVSATARTRHGAAKPANSAKATSSAKPTSSVTSASSAKRATSAKRTSSAKPAGSAKRASRRAAAPRGENKAKVLEVLRAGRPMTASEIAEATGIGAATASTLLTRMAKTGELTKAERGYALPQ